ncbi:MAG: tRNA preQ1(34) S-adenosylmethionine ribosyltransferase-isomerase QueA [Candidatus Hydrogenedentes bacterium]|nr:tRNA preQ1(34) S-adenosylmethionine ribosyltransferase-isomerase QueA [Candidatus Hydrogenedentota bacterium]
MRTDALDYPLPEELIAQSPVERRDEARLLVLDRADESMRVDVFRNINHYLAAGDCLVVNDTRVIRARLRAKKTSGGNVEVFLLHEEEPGAWTALVRPSGKVRPGTTLQLPGNVKVVVGEHLGEGRRRVTFSESEVIGLLERIGEIPLPPYIHRARQDPVDAERYQTVYARTGGAVAAPTAGLHYTEAVLASLGEQGVRRATLTLHVGYGTFKPITAERLEDHVVESEDFVLPEETAALLNETRRERGRIVAVGTTATRVLETQFWDGKFHAGWGKTSKYIYPPYSFQAVDVLQTNFHLPKSSLLALVCAFAGVEFVMRAYEFAVRERFRFYSYGDTMLIL